MEQLLPILIPALLCALVGFGLGSFASKPRNEKDNSDPAPNKNLVEVVRLCRERSGSAVLEVNGKTFRSASQLTPEQKLYLLKLLESWRGWLGVLPSEGANHRKEDGAQPGDGRQVEESPAKAVEVSGNQPVHPAVEAASLGQNPAVLRQQGTGGSPEKVSLNPVEMFARAFKSDGPPPPPKSIAAQVDEIVQEMLDQPEMQNSSLRTKGIRLMELPGKGMVVMVGLEQYAGVEDVPDAEVKQLLKAAVAEWERRSEDYG